ncbi:MAG: ATP-binding cassette domain-containing protein [Anaerolineaceae bacterium]|nr:ATP-binding cassette domain-containing protein [Anaerolineaceae bacterium]
MINNNNDYILEVKGLKKYFPLSGGGFLRKVAGYIKAVDDVSFYIRRGETVGVVGESGCGKTTLGRCISNLYAPTAGQMTLDLDGNQIDISRLDKSNKQIFRKNVQMIFQDPYASLNPRMTVLNIVGEALLVNDIAKGTEREELVADMITRVGLKKEHLRRYPHSFSGGQRQRIGIARALVVNPQLVVADEPVSALDVSIQAQILNQLKDLQADFGLSYMFVSHNMSVIRYMSDRILVMYAGKLVETAPKSVLLRQPSHPYSELLLSAVPRITNRGTHRLVTAGEPPNLLALPKGCVFNPRCKYAKDICREVEPEMRQVGKDHFVRCHLDGLELTGI